MGFSVQLPAYRGPLDLLLYLVRRQEVGLGDLSLSKLVEQYWQYIEILRELDLGDAAEFLDVASTLVELKSQWVLPSVQDDDEPAIDSGSPAELIERLLEYKQLRDAADVLDEMGQGWQLRFARQCDDVPARQLDPGSQPIADLQLWDLVSAFGRIMREAGGPPPTEIIYDDTPIHVYMKKIHEHLRGTDRVYLVDLIPPGSHKSALIGWFLAVLELSRHHGAVAEQDEHGEIVIGRGGHYSDQLSVHEVDNYGASVVRASGLPTGMR